MASTPWQEVVTQLGALSVATVAAIATINNSRKIGRPNGKGNVVEMSESILREIGSLRGAFDERAQRIDSLRVEVDDHTLRIGRLEGANREEREP
jgi:hypothetical protein